MLSVIFFIDFCCLFIHLVFIFQDSITLLVFSNDIFKFFTSKFIFLITRIQTLFLSHLPSLATYLPSLPTIPRHLLFSTTHLLPPSFDQQPFILSNQHPQVSSHQHPQEPGHFLHHQVRLSIPFKCYKRSLL